jgi:hypothetical protein
MNANHPAERILEEIASEIVCSQSKGELLVEARETVERIRRLIDGYRIATGRPTIGDESDELDASEEAAST